MNPGASRTAADHHIVQDDPRSLGFATRTSSAQPALSATRCSQFLPEIFAAGKQERHLLKAKLVYYRCSTAKVLYWPHLQGAIDGYQESFDWAEVGQGGIPAHRFAAGACAASAYAGAGIDCR
ncbi:MAG: hypothetical protein EOS58_27760 [Mesorhizobium sp.]|uniref:hypothetical protein n=1 Tax=unclassified Mesorhizobium TaxID=325217 RepID=UPI000F752EA2|nr:MULTISPECIES: hypothetical protein [unclassified Mesorhizobium]RVC81686.1 hypothetical protein EN766_02710 [Mesorhizobium sp. M2A.F.Ca.ET.046.02.1.1]AZO34142.1 hypothetical protein EJ072_06325 [Mesorhizobium sp. M2A.F.Ca.ET.046.03.2.1]AZO71570.1 hypothetical protein EJ067_10705 [Mesorhizobium sp. M1D.F.Ca.ET.043.01.1.1]RWB49853.1 MAG: hypothetical protein EOQ44_01765 [Mesorhizobium sp.]RWD00902.1 MAG: hypothetical protein EOS58_27760 [Mesorhizobium sp.]